MLTRVEEHSYPPFILCVHVCWWWQSFSLSNHLVSVCAQARRHTHTHTQTCALQLKKAVTWQMLLEPEVLIHNLWVCLFIVGLIESDGVRPTCRGTSSMAVSALVVTKSPTSYILILEPPNTAVNKTQLRNWNSSQSHTKHASHASVNRALGSRDIVYIYCQQPLAMWGEWELRRTYCMAACHWETASVRI